MSTKKCHYIPQVYLKQWASTNNLKVYDKISRIYIENGMSIKNNFCENNLYNFTYDIWGYATNFKEIEVDIKNKIDLFLKENDLEILINDSEREIKDLKLTEIGTNEIKFMQNKNKITNSKNNDFLNQLKQIKSTLIEDFLNKKIETKFNDFVKYIEISSLENYFSISEEYVEYLYLLILTMAIRDRETSGMKIIIETFKDTFKLIADILYSNKNDDKTFIEKVKLEHQYIYFLKQLYQLLFNDDSEILKILKENIWFEIYISDSLFFNTSDVPCFEHKQCYEVDNSSNGIYFPLSPSILLIGRKCTNRNNNINIEYIDNNKIEYYNQIIKQNAIKYVIEKDRKD